MKQRALRATASGASTTENLLEEERQLTRIDHDYDDIPGSSRRGYGINMFCMSLLKKANRDEFKVDEAKYLDR